MTDCEWLILTLEGVGCMTWPFPASQDKLEEACAFLQAPYCGGSFDIPAIQKLFGSEQTGIGGNLLIDFCLHNVLGRMSIS